MGQRSRRRGARAQTSAGGSLSPTTWCTLQNGRSLMADVDEQLLDTAERLYYARSIQGVGMARAARRVRRAAEAHLPAAPGQGGHRRRLPASGATRAGARRWPRTWSAPRTRASACWPSSTGCRSRPPSRTSTATPGRNAYGELGSTSEVVAEEVRRHKAALRDYLSELVADAGGGRSAAHAIYFLVEGAMVTAAIDAVAEARQAGPQGRAGACSTTERRADTLDGWVVTDAPTALEVLRDPRCGARTASTVHAPPSTTPGSPSWRRRTRCGRVARADAAGARRPRRARPRPPARRPAPPFAPAAVAGCGRWSPRRSRPRWAIVTGEPVDVVAAFTRPVPFRVVARLLALPRADWPVLEALAAAASTDDTANEDRAALRSRLLAERDVMRFFARLDGPGSDDDTHVLPVLRAAVADGAITRARPPGCAARCSSPARTRSATCSRARSPNCSAAAGRPGRVRRARLAVDPPFTAFWRRATRATRSAGVECPRAASCSSRTPSSTTAPPGI